MLYIVEASASVETVKTTMDERAKEYKFGLLKDYNFQEMFELCFPPAAQQAMENIPAMSVYLPCRVSLFEENGKTKLTTIEMEEIMQNFDLPDDFKKNMGEVYKRLQNLMNSFNK